MIQSYRTLVDAESLEVLPNTGKKKEAVMKYIIELANLSEEGKRRMVRDPKTKEEFHVSRLHGYLLTWWVDHPVKRVIVVDITLYR